MLFLKNFTQYIKENFTQIKEGMDLSGKRYKVSDITAIKEFILAGNAIFTLESQTSGLWYTYKVKQAKNNDTRFFVNVLRGPSNTSDYTYLGMITKYGDELSFGLTKNSKYKFDAPCYVVFDYFFKHMVKNFIHPKLNFYHMGYCGRCGRGLTTPESIIRGIGPVCNGMIGEEEEINRDRRNKLTKMRKEWNYQDVLDKRKQKF